MRTFATSAVLLIHATPRKVLEIAAAMDRAGVRADIVTYNSLLGACVAAGQLERAMTLFAEMQARCCHLWHSSCRQLLGTSLGILGIPEAFFACRREAWRPAAPPTGR